MTEKLDWFNECAHEAVKLPEGWLWYQISAVGRHPNFQGTMVKGAVPTRMISRGRNKGHPDWRTADKETEREVFVSESAFDARRARFEAETGKCHACQGDGQEVQSWSAEKGVTYRDCSRCKGSGLAPAPVGRRGEAAETQRGSVEDEHAVTAAGRQAP